MDCFNHNCPFRTNETSNMNRCDCYSCKVRDSESVYVNSNKIITNDTVLKKLVTTVNIGNVFVDIVVIKIQNTVPSL